MMNLNSKIALLVHDLDSLDEHGRARVIEGFIRTELALRSEIRYLDEFDVNSIKARATRILTDTPMSRSGDAHDQNSFTQNPEFFRISCFAQATIELLRAKHFLPNMVTFRKSGQKLVPCEHLPVASGGSDSVCSKCGKGLVATNWKIAE